MNKLIKNKNSGFTLVETLVALSIFSVTLVIVMGLLGKGVSDINYAKRKITAEYLAQEGIEYVRSIRDTFILSDGGTQGWTNFNNKLRAQTAGCNSGEGCYFNSDDTFSLISDITLNHCNGTCPSLLFDSTTGTYGYSGGSASGFIRKIQSDEIVHSDEIVPGAETEISATVYWMQGTQQQSITFTESLFNWVE